MNRARVFPVLRIFPIRSQALACSVGIGCCLTPPARLRARPACRLHYLSVSHKPAGAPAALTGAYNRRNMFVDSLNQESTNFLARKFHITQLLYAVFSFPQWGLRKFGCDRTPTHAPAGAVFNSLTKHSTQLNSIQLNLN